MQMYGYKSSTRLIQTSLVPLEQTIFFGHVEKTETCWIWKGTKNSSGYGILHIAGYSQMVHRASYRHYKGEIPRSLEIDHLCRNKLCVNPDHLEAVTHQENVQRFWSKKNGTKEN